jgi:hypothetical protein
MRKLLEALILLLVIPACGNRSSSSPRLIPVKVPKETVVKDIPLVLEFTGAFVGRPEPTVQDLGPSTLVKMEITVEGTTVPFHPELWEALDPERNRGVEWAGAIEDGCALSPLHVSKLSGQPLTLRVLLMGWDDKEAEPHCLRAMDRIKQQGFKLLVHNALVRPQSRLTELRVHAVASE